MKMKWWTAISVVGAVAVATAVGAQVRFERATELIEALKRHYVDREKLEEKQLEEATVAGILAWLGEAVKILPAEPVAAEQAAVAESGGALARAEVIEPEIGYVRLAQITEATVAALDAELEKFARAKVTAVVLDLRFAHGTDYAAAAQVAGRFSSPGRLLFRIKRSEGGEMEFYSGSAERAEGQPGSEWRSVPLMVLINAQTRGSAEALAGALRAQERAILIGAGTAGSAVAWEDVRLSDGRLLRVASAKVVLPGLEVFPDGVAPDVPVRIDPKREREAVLELGTDTTLTATLQPRQKRKMVSEAELVKAFRGEAVEMRGAEGSTEAEGELREVRDVVLQRAVDILKGIRTLLSWN